MKHLITSLSALALLASGQSASAQVLDTSLIANVGEFNDNDSGTADAYTIGIQASYNLMENFSAFASRSAGEMEFPSGTTLDLTINQIGLELNYRFYDQNYLTIDSAARLYSEFGEASNSTATGDLRGTGFGLGLTTTYDIDRTYVITTEIGYESSRGSNYTSNASSLDYELSTLQFGVGIMFSL